MLKVLTFYDVPGWAWYYRALNLKKNLLDDIELTMVSINEKVDANLFDLIILFNPCFVDYIPEKTYHKTIIGCSTSIPGYLDQTAYIIKDCSMAAGMVNNREGYLYLKDKGCFYLCENGVDHVFFQPPNHSPDRITACWIGNSSSDGKKGLNLIREACRKKNVPLIYHDVNAIKDFSHVLTQKELKKKFYHRASFYICASEKEGTPNPALEAMACGMPVLSTGVGNMPDIIIDGYNGFIVERTIESIEDGIDRLKKMNLKKMSLNARTSIESGWTWNQKADNYRKMIKSLVNIMER